MAKVEYILGSVEAIRELYPPAKYAFDPVKDYRGSDVTLHTYRDVIRQYTQNSLAADGFAGFEVEVTREDGVYSVAVSAEGPVDRLKMFADRHVLLFSSSAGGKAVVGKRLMEQFEVWNPMSGYPVNRDKNDGDCKWHLFPPLGLNIMGQRGVLLMHYPPWQVLQQSSFLEVMTMHRWNTVLQAAGVPRDEISFYRTFVDVNPIAAPGSGQSEYPNDYFPIMMASAFFHGPNERDYIRSMLELYVAPPGGGGKEYTLPLLICGSPLYDPQAPGWFRVTYKDQLPKNADGTPTIDVLQAGAFRIRPDSERETPYMGANHMIAAGVTGKCMEQDTEIPAIQVYEAQDLVAASFLYEYAKDPDLDPAEAKRRACQRWFGNPTGEGPPKPSTEDRQIICALAQMDLFFTPAPIPHPTFTFEEAMKRCECADNGLNPCAPPIDPPDGTADPCGPAESPA